MERDSFVDYCTLSDLVDEFVTTGDYSPNIDVDKFIEAIKKEPYRSFILGILEIKNY